ncbi:protease pro-enzyme activation domain-containing protein [Phytohabitans flavus]|uniref:S53 family peptidase n=1 Tax=Phytohabitans flavus TaxID=1076124 RepID=UPI003633A2C8
MDARAEVTLLLRRRRDLRRDLAAGLGILRRAELAERYGADPADVALTERVLGGYGLKVLDTDPGSRRVTVAGTLAELAEAFGAKISLVEDFDHFSGVRGEYREREGELHLPTELDGVVLAVLGLDTRPRYRPELLAIKRQPNVVYTPPELASLYRFPEGTDGTGQTLAIVVMGGGFRDEDMDSYFAGLGLPKPAIRTVAVDGVDNTPGGAGSIEVVLDVQIAGALAPGAQIVVYFAPNSDRGALNALHAAIHADPTPTAISLSWGASEVASSGQLLDAMDDLFAEAAALGVTVVAASGDGGSSNGLFDGVSHVNFPASSPHVLACGGTTLLADPQTGTIMAETVWNTGAAGVTGGGVSRAFDLPTWQAGAGYRTAPARISQDVACPTWRPMATPQPATRYTRTASWAGSVAPAPAPRCGPRWSAGWHRHLAGRSASSSR